MKRLLIVLLFCASSAFGQGVRFTPPPITSTATVSGTTVTVPVTASTIAFCSKPANAVPCTNKATTYTDSTLGTPCGLTVQVVLDGTTSCVGAPDSLGNWGIWAPPNEYAYTITASGGASFGPFYVTLSLPTNLTGTTISGTPTFSGLPTFAAGAQISPGFAITAPIFLSSNGNAALSGTIRLNSTDQQCWRNNANNVNLCMSKTAGDIFQLNGLNITNTIGTGNVTTPGTAVSSGTCQAQTGITVSGALTSDSVVPNIGAALPATWQTGIQPVAHVTASGTVTVYLCNPTAGSITPVATQVNVRVLR